jgi:transcriptional regulator PpsR
MSPAANPGSLIGALDAGQASRMVKAASDIALILDEAGTIVDIAQQDAELPSGVTRSWLGRPWVQTVTIESRQKVEALLRDARAATATSRWRQVNHATAEGEDLSLLYAAVRLGPPGAGGADGQRRMVAFGRSLRSTVVLQRRLVEAQQAMERDYWRFREAETRYRHLFQASSEAVLIVDVSSQRILEANPARVLWPGRPTSWRCLSTFVCRHRGRKPASAAGGGTVGGHALRLTLADRHSEVTVGASVFRQDDSAFALVRLAALPLHPAAGSAAAQADGLLQSFVHNSADALVFTDAHGRVLSANRAFAMLAQIGSDVELRGQMLDRWVGRTGVELGVLVANLRQRGTAGLFLTQVRSELGGSTDVEIAASVVQQGDDTVLAFAIRNIERRLRSEQAAHSPITRSVGDLTELVGNVPLKEIVSETTDLIEQLCIETALQMTGDKRASAALLLGLSRQSLYVKLRRFGISTEPAAGED